MKYVHRVAFNYGYHDTGFRYFKTHETASKFLESTAFEAMQFECPDMSAKLQYFDSWPMSWETVETVASVTESRNLQHA
jgi:transcription initiation factor IIE alpha subunit